MARSIRTVEEIEEEYDLELPNVIENIKKEKAKLVLLQFPEKMKPYSMAIIDELKKHTNAKFII